MRKLKYSFRELRSAKRYIALCNALLPLNTKFGYELDNGERTHLVNDTVYLSQPCTKERIFVVTEFTSEHDYRSQEKIFAILTNAYSIIVS